MDISLLLKQLWEHSWKLKMVIRIIALVGTAVDLSEQVNTEISTFQMKQEKFTFMVCFQVGGGAKGQSSRLCCRNRS